MQLSTSSLKPIITILVILGMIGFLGYMGYSTLIDDAEIAEAGGTVNVSLYGPKLQKADQALNGAKLSFKAKDIIFSETSLYKSFIDPPETVPLSDTRGRPDPFVPYVAP